MLFAIALLIGIIAGLRSMTAPALTSWAANIGIIIVGGTWLGFMSSIWTSCLLSLAAGAELVTDQLPTTPSRTVPLQFSTRLLSGGLCGATLCASSGTLVIGAICGIVGAIIGTLWGAAFRRWLEGAMRNKRYAAITEDVIAIAGGALVLFWL